MKAKPIISQLSQHFNLEYYSERPVHSTLTDTQQHQQLTECSMSLIRHLKTQQMLIQHVQSLKTSAD